MQRHLSGSIDRRDDDVLLPERKNLAHNGDLVLYARYLTGVFKSCLAPCH
jgi:hypothetical protein